MFRMFRESLRPTDLSEAFPHDAGSEGDELWYLGFLLRGEHPSDVGRHTREPLGHRPWSGNHTLDYVLTSVSRHGSLATYIEPVNKPWCCAGFLPACRR